MEMNDLWPRREFFQRLELLLSDGASAIIALDLQHFHFFKKIYLGPLPLIFPSARQSPGP
jgi:hypothetical protein